MKNVFQPFCTTLNFSGETASCYYAAHITPLHAHNTQQFILDLKGTFLFRTAQTDWGKHKAVMIKENVVHQLNTNKSLQLIIYIDPASAIAQKFRTVHLADTDFCDISIELSPLEETLIYSHLIKPETTYIRLLTQLIFERINDAGTRRLADNRITQVLKLIRQTPPDELSIDQLAAKVFISPSRLRMQFKQLLGVSLHQYLIKQKILSAINFMINGSSIQDAAYRSGFNDSSHLNKLMGKLFHINPSLFIRENQTFSIVKNSPSFDLITRAASPA